MKTTTNYSLKKPEPNDFYNIEDFNGNADELDRVLKTLDDKISELNSNLFLRVYPVGSIYMSTSSTNPGTLFGGTWEAWGSGRVPVGVNSSDSDFSPAGKTGGTKTINLSHSHTVSSHTHTISHSHTVNSHVHTTNGHSLSINEIPSHSHSINKALRLPSSGAGWSFGGWSSGNNLNQEELTTTGSVGAGASHGHGNTGEASPATGGASSVNSGGASPGTNTQLSTVQSIVQPFITCYMWLRTA
ncbi:hypothetical protein MUB23_03975 [Cuneatibacter sp. NSJ-177]|uniref:phage baseplate protein n=1 Tax=Cuneatibacter sp. NSJ-177 TaxID=2931401 RepID=UPI001FD60D4E|nr:hypothetical protein [Cuneatibacter sp. NSJ-177]MCJ7834552.1 hypothetical protein [Cuneatibacter sp. NSJ-177]